jgi:glutamate-1-semialdehyde 2,1-aminomutase
MAALRLARAHTGRESYLAGRRRLPRPVRRRHVDVEHGGMGLSARTATPNLVPYGKGVPDTVKKLAHITPMNDLGPARGYVPQPTATKFAAMLIEPIQGNCCSIMASVDYVRLARELCDKYGVMLIIDEVKSGFRVGKSGIQGLMGVTPDITTFAKAVANGYPISVVAGREDVMRTFKYGGASHGGTYTAHSVSLAAAEETLRILDETPALETLANYGESLKAGISKILNARGVVPTPTPAIRRCSVCSSPRHPRTTIGHGKPRTIPSTTRWPTSCMTWAVICEPDSREPWFMCEAHGLDASCLTDTLKAVETAVDLTLEAVEQDEKRA